MLIAYQGFTDDVPLSDVIDNLFEFSCHSDPHSLAGLMLNNGQHIVFDVCPAHVECVRWSLAGEVGNAHRVLQWSIGKLHDEIVILITHIDISSGVTGQLARQSSYRIRCRHVSSQPGPVKQHGQISDFHLSADF